MSSDIIKSSTGFVPTNVNDAWRISEALARSEMVPKDYQQKPYNVMVALMVAQDCGISPFTVMQNMGLVYGRPAWSVKFLIAQANRAGVFSIPIQWEVKGKGKDVSVRAFATLKATGKEVSEEITMEQARAENWIKNPKYTTMPEHMLKWRAAGRLIDLYCPEVRFGVPTEVEAEDACSEEIASAATAEPAGILPPATRRGRPTGAKNRAKADEVPTTEMPLLAEPDPVAEAPVVSEPVPVPTLTADQQQALARLEQTIWEWQQSDDPEKAARIAHLREEQRKIREAASEKGEVV